MQSSQHSNIELYANILEPPQTVEDKRRGPGDKLNWGKVGVSDLQLSNGESERYHFSKIVQNASAVDLYTQAGLKTIVGRAITGINVSIVSIGMPQTFNNCEQIEREEKARFLTLAQETLKGIVNAPERRERYCAAAVVQIDVAGRIHPFDDSLSEFTNDVAIYKERVKMPFSLWHGDHGVVLPPEIFQEMCCQQDIEHFFTLYRVATPSTEPKSGVELVSIDNFQRGLEETSHWENAVRSTHPHTSDTIPVEAALMFVAEVFQSVSKGHDMRSTVVILHVPQRAERSITRHLWTSFENLLEHGKLMHSECSRNKENFQEQHPISSICQHILYGGGVCAAIFNIPKEEKNASHTLSILRHTKLFRAAKLLMPINYYHMPSCATAAITQFHQFQKGIKHDLSSAFAAGMYDGWKVGLKSAIKVVQDRIKQMRFLARCYLQKTRNAVLLRYEMIGQSLQSEYRKRKQIRIEQSKAQDESERILECKSRKQAQIDSVISERSIRKEEIVNLTEKIGSKRFEISEVRENRMEYLVKFQEELATLTRKLDLTNSEIEFLVTEIQSIRRGDQQAKKEHEIVFQLDYLEQVEIKRQEKEALLEKLRDLASIRRADDRVELLDTADPIMKEISEVSSIVTEKEQELAVIEAQITVLEKNFAQQHVPTRASTENLCETPGELSRFLSPAKSALHEDAELRSNEVECLALKNISMLIEQSPFDPHRLKKRDLENVTDHTAASPTPVKRAVKSTHVASRRTDRTSAQSRNASVRGSKHTPLAPKRKSEKASQETVKLTPTPISSRLRSSANALTFSRMPTARERSLQNSTQSKPASVSSGKGKTQRVSGEPVKMKKSIKKSFSRVADRDAAEVAMPKPGVKNENSKPSTRNSREAQAISPKPHSSKNSLDPRNSHFLEKKKAHPVKGLKVGNNPHSKTDRLTTPSKQAVRRVASTGSERVAPKSLVYQKLSKLAKNSSRKRELEDNGAAEENPEKLLRFSGPDESNGVVVLRKSAKPDGLESVPPPAAQEETVTKDASTGRKLVSLERDDSPGKLPSVGTMIKNFISNGTNVIQKTVKPRVLDFAAEKSNELFSFLHSESSTSQITEKKGRVSMKNGRHSQNLNKKKNGQRR